MINIFPNEGIPWVIMHVHCIKDRKHCSVQCVGLATPRPTPQCNVSNIKGNHSERCKFVQVLYQTSKIFTLYWVTHADLLHWQFL